MDMDPHGLGRVVDILEASGAFDPGSNPGRGVSFHCYSFSQVKTNLETNTCSLSSIRNYNRFFALSRRSDLSLIHARVGAIRCYVDRTPQRDDAPSRHLQRGDRT